MTDADLIVVGAGPKATAIAAKVHALGELGLAHISLLIIEQVESAASWSGVNGMTSGDEPLVITPLKDVGFPYQTHRILGSPGAAVDALLTEFSWTRHLIERDQYARWLNAGMPQVRHREYGRYLAWALSRAYTGVRVLRGRVARVTLEREPERWAIEVVGRDGTACYRTHALALTGSGIHRHLPHDADAAPRMFHCDGHRSEFGLIPPDRPCEIAIVGGGDGALSAITYLRQLRPKARLTIYTPGPPLSRSESFLENRVFSDPDCVSWDSLAFDTRRKFVWHADRGVFDTDTLPQLARDRHCAWQIGRVTHVSAARDALDVEYDAPTGPASARHDYVVNCTGFDLLEQLRKLFPRAVRAQLEARVGPIWEQTNGTELPFGRTLELRGLRPRLHIPGLAALSQGPGFANLGCLGLLSDRVLQPFMPIPTNTAHASQRHTESRSGEEEAARIAARRRLSRGKRR